MPSVVFCGSTMTPCSDLPQDAQTELLLGDTLLRHQQHRHAQKMAAMEAMAIELLDVLMEHGEFP